MNKFKSKDIMKKSFILMVVTLSSLVCRAGETLLDSLSYSLGYKVTLTLFAGENPLITNDEDFSNYIKGIDENLILPFIGADEENGRYNRPDDPSFKTSYSLGGMMAVFLFDGLEGKDEEHMPPVNCIVAGLRYVAEGQIKLPEDTIRAAAIIHSYPADADPVLLPEESRCEFFRAFGIMKAMAPDIQGYLSMMSPDSPVNADRRAYALGLADYLEAASHQPEDAYDLGRMLANSSLLKTLPFKLDKVSFIDGAKDVWDTGDPLIPRQTMDKLLEPYMSGSGM